MVGFHLQVRHQLRHTVCAFAQRALTLILITVKEELSSSRGTEKVLFHRHFAERRKTLPRRHLDPDYVLNPKVPLICRSYTHLHSLTSFIANKIRHSRLHNRVRDRELL